MSFDSPEFYALVFAVVMLLLMMFLSHREKGPGLIPKIKNCSAFHTTAVLNSLYYC